MWVNKDTDFNEEWEWVETHKQDQGLGSFREIEDAFKNRL
jgi:hypothetical protein